MMTLAAAGLYATLTALGQQAACEHVYKHYALIGKDPGVSRWIDENAAFYAECVKTLRYAR